MKNILLAILLIPTLVFAQNTTTTVAPKGTNVLIIPHTSYRKCMEVALDMGLQIDRHDDNLQYFYTVPVNRTKGFNDTHIYYVRVKGDTTYITGTWDPHMGGGGLIRFQVTSEPIMVKGWRTGGYIPNFILMDEFAHKISDSVLYAIKL